MGYASALILGRSQKCGLYRNDHFIEKEESLDLLTAKARIARLLVSYSIQTPLRHRG